jgi:hypothetical protein
MKKHLAILSGSLLALGITGIARADTPATQPAAAAVEKVGEKVPSDDPMLPDFHSLGLVDGETDLFRCGSPVRDLTKKLTTTQPSAETMSVAVARMQRMYDLGIRTIISFEDPDSAEDATKHLKERVALEKAAASKVGINFVSRPISNSGPNSLQDMTDQQVLQWVDPIAAEILADGKTGGVAFHCTAGHDRTGLVTAYIRIKYQHWSADQAIEEMRRYGHNWVKYSANGGISSWHEDHIRAIAKMLEAQSN